MTDSTDDGSIWPPKPTAPDQPECFVDGFRSLLRRMDYVRGSVIAMVCLDAVDVAISIAIGWHPSVTGTKTAIGVAIIVLTITAWTVYLGWIAQACRNVNSLDRQRRPIAAAAAVIQYMLPFVNLYRPYLTMRTIWDRSVTNPDLPVYNNGRRIIAWWWATGLLHSSMALIALLSGAEHASDLAVRATILFGEWLVEIVHSVILIRMVVIVSQMQEASHTRQLGKISREQAALVVC